MLLCPNACWAQGAFLKGTPYSGDRYGTSQLIMSLMLAPLLFMAGTTRLSPPVPPCLSLQSSWASTSAGPSGDSEQIHTMVFGASVRGSGICSSIAPLGHPAQGHGQRGAAWGHAGSACRPTATQALAPHRGQGGHVQAGGKEKMTMVPWSTFAD